MKLHNLQVLRAVAAIAVVIFHATGIAPKYTGYSSQIESATRGMGGHGVDLFFVISGFIMRYAQPLGGYLWWPFLRARLERIVPLYWLLTGLMLFIWIVIPNAFAGAVPDWIHVVRSILFISFGAGELPVIYVGWSLECEMFFYLVIVCALLSNRRPWTTVMTVLPLFVLLGSLIPITHNTSASIQVISFITNPLLLEFAFGVLLADYLTIERIRKWPCFLLAVSTLAVFLTDPSSRSLVVGVPSALILWVFIWLEKERKIIVAPWLIRFGDASYSIYLVQVFALSAAAKLLGEQLRGSPDLFVIAVALISILAGLACHAFVETRLLKMTRSLHREYRVANKTV